MADYGDVLDTKWGRAIVIGALLSSLGSGAINFNKDTTDRFKGADWRAGIAIRDQRIAENKRDIERVDESHHEHLEHSAQYTQIILHQQREIDRLEERIKQLEREHD